MDDEEEEGDELSKQLAKFSEYQQRQGLIPRADDDEDGEADSDDEEDDDGPQSAQDVWADFDPWDFNALPSIETSLAELRAGGALSACPRPPQARRLARALTPDTRSQRTRSARSCTTGGSRCIRRTRS